MNLIDTNAGGWRLQEAAGRIQQAQEIERAEKVVSNWIALEQQRRALRNDPPDMTWDF